MLGRMAAAAGDSGGPPAPPRVIAIQMRHGKPKTPDVLKPQMLTRAAPKAGRRGRGGSGAPEHVPLLLSLHGGKTVKDGVYVSQEAKFGRRGASAFPKGSFLEVNAEHLCDTSVVWSVDLTGPGAAK